MSHPSLRFAFFGTGPLAESVLATLVRDGYTPALVVTKPAAPQGRHMIMTEPVIKTWCDMKGIPVIQPASVKELPADSPLLTETVDLFIVASYGKIIPDAVLTRARLGALNVHPSLLPLYRGPSPIESALLDGNTTLGVTIIKLDDQVDHGPILVQQAFTIDQEATAGTLEVSCGQLGGALLSQVLPHYLDSALLPQAQDDSKATFCKKIEKEMGEITLETDALTVIQKYRALTPWPGLYFMLVHEDTPLRVKINKIDIMKFIAGGATAKDIILSVTPAGKKEISWDDFKRGYLK